ncbi:hypothetical protein LTR36_003838 [Oleoguttula mirabilis]|uniref:BTB domain-containing protein n=1 Tax=Oleoguttula mirabilis TaxID=1507867 RepID=A0AAV9JJ66_9PEZI|nr:hypothetical protein LTR36_003838 [Oleoguttula mirabilis]
MDPDTQGEVDEQQNQLQQDRMIHFYVGDDDDTEPFCIKQSGLEWASPFFVCVIKYEHWGTDAQHCVLRFPDDDVEAWHMLIYWFDHSADLHSTPHKLLATRCWILGDKYGIPKFQDEAMLGEVAAHAPRDSPLVAFIAEMMVYHCDEEVEEELASLAFTTELLDALDRIHGMYDSHKRMKCHGDSVFERYDRHHLCEGWKTQRLEGLEMIKEPHVLTPSTFGTGGHASTRKATTKTKLAMEELCQALMSDRLVQIFVGSDSDRAPFLVQQTILADCSEYFVKALRPNSFSEGVTSILRVPDDSLDVWQVFLYWLFRVEIPTASMTACETTLEYHELLVRCWVHGDKYGVAGFQDQIMVGILQFLESSASSLRVVKLAFDNTAPGSRLRTLMAEEAACLLKGRCETSVAVEELDLLDGVIGFTSALVAAFTTHDSLGNDMSNRLYEINNERSDRWREFMVGEDVTPRWIYGD